MSIIDLINDLKVARTKVNGFDCLHFTHREYHFTSIDRRNDMMVIRDALTAIHRCYRITAERQGNEPSLDR